MNRYFILIFLLSFLNCKNNEEPSDSAPESADTSSMGIQHSDAPEAEVQKKDSLLNIAYQNFQKDSNKLENIIWYGRRLAYLSKFEEAIEVYTQGLQKFPKSPELFRHRGHRYISTRQFDAAISDFEKAAFYVKNRNVEIEPDGIPNKLNQPLSSLQFNIWYHWALAYYLKGDFIRAAKLYEAGMAYSTNPDLLCATSDWLYMTYRRMGQIKKAKTILADISPDLEIVENTAYYQRLLMYKGLKKPEELFDYQSTKPKSSLDAVTQGYGVGNFYLYNQDTTSAKIIFTKVLESDYKSAFGYIATEADMQRINSN